ncbi:NOL1/NOP2/sun family putative RNA methylase [Aliikangiella sp. G2MR2-5]|uniref:NOL1/NOP2/sun family putative RNA methylase n=1 Tax=Aliikangiella sp. G2MR2-5 TaxID=2788943 RepID=UPI0018A926FF|nr:NOL1/NOP2/sun family putative RNA methylase [Aliikangiella sp. G2MR2-5]
MSLNKNIPLKSGGELSADYLAHARATFLSEADEAAFIHSCGQPLRKSIRLNRLKTSQNEFSAIASKYGWILTPVPWCEDGFWIDLSQANHSLSLGNLPEHIQGLFYIQEASSMLPPVALLPDDIADSVLVGDIAAAPGSKTTQMASMMENRGIIWANELSASRLKGLHSNLVRCGILNTCLSHQDGRVIGDLMPGQFDYLLLDAPCGGEGTVRKDFDALKSWDIERVRQLAVLQKELIASAYRALKPGGRLVYSTCTLSPEENQQVANYLVSETNAQVIELGSLFPGAQQARTEEGYLLVLPQLFDSEGFFISCFEKPESAVIESQPVAKFNGPFEPISKTEKKRLLDYFSSHFGVNIEPEGYQLLQREKDVWIFPAMIESLDRYIKVNRSGMKLATVYPSRSGIKVRASHEFCCCFGDKASKQVVTLNSEQASDFYRGQNIVVDCQSLKDGETILKFANKSLGMGLNKKGRIKNLLPRDLVRDGICFPP